jgi:hypothetical protein
LSCHFCLAAFPFLPFILASFHPFIFSSIRFWSPFSFLSRCFTCSLLSLIPFVPLSSVLFALPVKRLFCFFYTSPHACLNSIYLASCFFLSNLLTLSFHVWFRFGLFLAFFIYFLVFFFAPSLSIKGDSCGSQHIVTDYIYWIPSYETNRSRITILFIAKQNRYFLASREVTA